jgi:hypothetical protein
MTRECDEAKDFTSGGLPPRAADSQARQLTLVRYPSSTDSAVWRETLGSA